MSQARTGAAKTTQPKLCRKAFTAFGATAGNNPNATNGRHALAEAMAAFAHEAARLIGAFHGRLRQG